jgi:hypothetical protein
MLLAGLVGLMLAPRRASGQDDHVPTEPIGFRRASVVVFVALLAMDAAVAAWAMVTGHTSLRTDAGGTIAYPFWVGPILLAGVPPLGWVAVRWIARMAPRQFTRDATWAASADRDLRLWLMRQTRFATAQIIGLLSLALSQMYSWGPHSPLWTAALIFIPMAAFLVGIVEMGAGHDHNTLMAQPVRLRRSSHRNASQRAGIHM